MAARDGPGAGNTLIGAMPVGSFALSMSIKARRLHEH